MHETGSQASVLDCARPEPIDRMVHMMQTKQAFSEQRHLRLAPDELHLKHAGLTHKIFDNRTCLLFILNRLKWVIRERWLKKSLKKKRRVVFVSSTECCGISPCLPRFRRDNRSFCCDDFPPTLYISLYNHIQCSGKHRTI